MHLEQEHVDCKIVDTLLKKGTKLHTDGWDTVSPNSDGDFGVTFNDITKDDSFYTTTSRFVT